MTIYFILMLSLVPTFDFFDEDLLSVVSLQCVWRAVWVEVLPGKVTVTIHVRQDVVCHHPETGAKRAILIVLVIAML